MKKSDDITCYPGDRATRIFLMEVKVGEVTLKNNYGEIKVF